MAMAETTTLTVTVYGNKVNLMSGDARQKAKTRIDHFGYGCTLTQIMCTLTHISGAPC